MLGIWRIFSGFIMKEIFLHCCLGIFISEFSSTRTSSVAINKEDGWGPWWDWVGEWGGGGMGGNHTEILMSCERNMWLENWKSGGSECMDIWISCTGSRLFVFVYIKMRVGSTNFGCISINVVKDLSKNPKSYWFTNSIRRVIDLLIQSIKHMQL